MSLDTPTVVHAFQQIADAVIAQVRQSNELTAAQTRRLDALTAKVDDVRERMIGLEAQKHDKAIEDLRRRMDGLESQRDQAVGAARLGGWVSKHAPWLASVVATVLTILGLDRLR